jgi:hypothetical protein
MNEQGCWMCGAGPIATIDERGQPNCVGCAARYVVRQCVRCDSERACLRGSAYDTPLCSGCKDQDRWDELPEQLQREFDGHILAGEHMTAVRLLWRGTSANGFGLCDAQSLTVLRCRAFWGESNGEPA